MTILEFVQQKLNEGGTDAMLSESLLTATINRAKVRNGNARKSHSRGLSVAAA